MQNDFDFRESFYTRQSDPLSEVDSTPLALALGLHISTKARPNDQGMLQSINRFKKLDIN